MVVIDSHEHLTAFLTKELAPICDADPASLAKYVLALINKPDKTVEQLKETCMGQLDVFLQSSTRRFVENLFNTLADKSYLPAPPEPPKEEKRSEEEKPKEKEREKEKPREERKRDDRDRRGRDKEALKDISPPREERHRVPPPSNGASTASTSDRKEAKKENEQTTVSASSSTSTIPPPPRRSPPRGNRKRISPPPAMRRRISPPSPDPKRRRSRSPARRRGTRRSPERRQPHKERRSRSPVDRHERRREEEKPRKKLQVRCRDFDERGYCMRGDQCPYDHGPDPVVVDDSALEKIVSIPPGPTNGAPKPPNYSMPPPGYNPMNPPPPGVEGAYAVSGGGPPGDQGYNPEAPGLVAADFSVPPPPLPNVMGGPWRANPYTNNLVIPQQVYDPTSNIPVDPHMDPSTLMGGAPMMRGGMRGRGRGRGAYHPYARQQMQPGQIAGPKAGLEPQVAARTIVVKKIPVEMNNIAKLNEHFEQFGSIVNMQVQFEGDPQTALITYTNRQEAMSAIRSTEPIFNNRFIRVFWYANDQQQQQAGQNGAMIPKPVEEKPKVPMKLPDPSQTKFRNPAAVATKTAKHKQKMDSVQRAKLLDVQRRKIDVLDKLNEHQKQVIAKLMKCTVEEDRKATMKMYKQLEKKIQATKAEVEKFAKELATPKAEAEEQTTPPPNSADTVKTEEEESGVAIVESKNIVIDDQNTAPLKGELVSDSQISPGTLLASVRDGDSDSE